MWLWGEVMMGGIRGRRRGRVRRDLNIFFCPVLFCFALFCGGLLRLAARLRLVKSWLFGV